MGGNGLWLLCLLLFADGATFSFFTTPLLLHYGQRQEPWAVAIFGSLASALGSMIQFAILRWLMSSSHPWMQRFAPSRERLEGALRAYPAASFLALAVARATPLPDAPLKLVAAALEYPVTRYGLAIFVGALPYYFALALVGRVVKIPAWVLIAASAAIVLGAVVDRVRRSRRTEP